MSNLLCSGLALALISLGAPLPFATTALPPTVPSAEDTRVEDKEEITQIAQSSIDRMLELLQDEKITPKARREGVKDVIDQLVDLELLGRLALGSKRWGKISDAQKKSFSSLFVETVRQSVFEQLELFTDEKVELGKPEPIKTSGSPKYRVLAWIVSNGQRTELALLFAKREAGWRVYDLEVEGISQRKSYGNEYADFLKRKSFDDLLAKMREKVEAAKERMAKADAKAAG